MTALARLRAWQSKNTIHDYRKGTMGHRLLYDWLAERFCGGGSIGQGAYLISKNT